MLKVENLTIQYNKKDKPVVEEVSFGIKRGEIACLVGESGSGKTSVIRAIHGILPGQGRVIDGDILYDGRSILKNTVSEWQKIRGSEISMVFQDSGSMLNPVRTIGSQFVEYIRVHEPCTKKEAWYKGVQMLEGLQLHNGNRIMKSYPFQLSGGMIQRVGIAFAMIFRPKLLLADEPTSALDVITQAQIVRQMMELSEASNTSILLATHNLALAAYISDLILVMKDGHIVDRGSRTYILEHSQNEHTRMLLSAVPKLGDEYYV